MTTIIDRACVLETHRVVNKGAQTRRMLRVMLGAGLGVTTRHGQVGSVHLRADGHLVIEHTGGRCDIVLRPGEPILLAVHSRAA